MEDLISLVNEVPAEAHETWFGKIADLLLKKYVIQTSNGRYRLTEIEFYYHSATHADTAAYGYVDEQKKYDKRILRHKEAQGKTMTWFFHYSGVDIVFGRAKEPGGILLRAMRNVETDELIKGPLVVMLELLNQGVSVMGGDGMKLELVKNDKVVESKVERTTRVGIGYGGKEKEEYNYWVK